MCPHMTIMMANAFIIFETFRVIMVSICSKHFSKEESNPVLNHSIMIPVNQ